MRLQIAVAGLALSFAQSAIAQDNAALVVPVEKAPFHVPAFKNEYVTMLNVYIPAGRTAGYHKHSIDYVFVFVERAKTKAQVLGEQPVDRDIPAGTVNYANYTKKPVTHQVSNVDSNPFRVVGFEIMYPEAGRFTPSERSEATGYKPVLDNERARGWRLVLEPGASVPAITQKAPGIRIVLTGGDIAESGPEQPGQDMNLKLGDFIWQEPGTTRAVRNTGTTRVDLFEFELK